MGRRVLLLLIGLSSCAAPRPGVPAPRYPARPWRPLTYDLRVVVDGLPDRLSWCEEGDPAGDAAVMLTAAWRSTLERAREHRTGYRERDARWVLARRGAQELYDPSSRLTLWLEGRYRLAVAEALRGRDPGAGLEVLRDLVYVLAHTDPATVPWASTWAEVAGWSLTRLRR